MRNIIFGLALAVVGAGAHAGGSATVTCGSGGYQNGKPPVLNINYVPTGDAGTPGLFFLGVLSPDEQSGAVMTPQGWVTYSGGLYPFKARYDAGLPGSIPLNVAFPGGGLTTQAYVGYKVYVGHGAYTAAGRASVADRRTSLNEAKPTLVAEGVWKPELEDDERFIYALVQKDMVDNRKFGILLTVPFLDCSEVRY